jgi:hydroxymethylpyrimidine/phosphomethylpyrimidine kinase
MTAASPPVGLTIAGSDPSGGAGIQADLTTFAAHGVHGTSVVTALTAQNTLGVQGVEVTPPAFVAAQLDSVLADLSVSAVKTGMLATEEIVRLVAERAVAGDLPSLVVDPVMVASTGSRLLTEGAERAYVEALLPAATVITPNLREATVLLGSDRALATSADVRARADALQALCPGGWVVVTGGHADPDTIGSVGAVDLVLHDGEVHELVGAWVPTDNDHGTGCTFAAATAARLAHGDDPLAAIGAAKTFVASQIRRSAGWRLGHGRGPVAHTFG